MKTVNRVSVLLLALLLTISLSASALAAPTPNLPAWANAHPAASAHVPPAKGTPAGPAGHKAHSTFSSDNLQTTYPFATGITEFWNRGYSGQGIGVAVLDSGVANHPDLRDVTRVKLPRGDNSPDKFGHGTLVAGIISGQSADGRYVGVAPESSVYAVKVTDREGKATGLDLLRGLYWVYQNHERYNIRVVNLSMQASLPQSYRTSVIAAAIEQLWLEGVVVVVSAGNRGGEADNMYYTPANDPYVITVGAYTDQATRDRLDDMMTPWTSSGRTQDGYVKPEILAPGSKIVAPIAKNSYLARNNSSRIVDGQYLRASGTSLAAPIVSGIAANILSMRPELNPDQVKWLISNNTYGHGRYGMVDAEGIISDLEMRTIPSANRDALPNEYIDPNGDGIVEGDIFFENIFFENIFFENIFFENIFFENIFFENIFFENIFFENLIFEDDVSYLDNIFFV